MKGIILAGGTATRLYPITKTISKQILPIYDKPMIYYPLSTLMLAGIKDILIISTNRDIETYKNLLGNGTDIGINISYAIQEQAKGLAEAFIIGEDFIGDDNVCLILGDNVFYGRGLSELLTSSSNLDEGALIFAYNVPNPSQFGVVEFDLNGKVLSLEEKPINPKSNFAVPGIYFYDNSVVEISKNIKPSKRGELEITDIHNVYLNQNKLKVELFGRGTAWLDTGTPDGLLEASNFVHIIQKRQGLYVSCIEEIAYQKGYISKDKLIESATRLKNTEYGEYLLNICKN